MRKLIKDLPFISDNYFRMTNVEFGLDADRNEIIRFCLFKPDNNNSHQIWRMGYCLFNISSKGIDRYIWVGHAGNYPILECVEVDPSNEDRLRITGIDEI